MANRQLVLWRHGRTSWNLEQRFQGQTDIPLDEVGEQQAKECRTIIATFKTYLHCIFGFKEGQ